MNDFCFCSVAVSHATYGVAYLRQLDRLEKSIKKIYPEAHTFFRWDTLPPGAKPFLDSLYGLKPHSVQEARDAGFKKVLWLDPAMILVDKVDDIVNSDTIAIRDETLLWDVISDYCLNYFELTRHEIKRMDWHLVGGSMYYFDFNYPKVESIFKMWIDAEKAGMFGSQDEQSFGKLQGHRSDETVMAIAMYLHGVKPDNEFKRYCSEINPMVIKKHFR